MISAEERELRSQVEQVRGRLQRLAADLRAVDDEVESLATQRTQHELLDQACGSLEKLGGLGAAPLFWGERMEPARVVEQLRGVRNRISAFQARLGEVDDRRRAILIQIGREEDHLEILGEDLHQVREAEERRKLEWVVEREIGPVPGHVQLMAWARGGEDDRRFRKTLAASLLASLLLGVLFPMIDLPQPARLQPEDMPDRIVQFIRKEQARPSPPPAVVKPPPEQTRPEQQKPKPAEEPKPSGPQNLPAPETAVAEANPPGPPELPPGAPGSAGAESQARAGKAGILAFRDTFASLAKDKVVPRLGADARYNDARDAAPASTRSMLTTGAPGSSRGINITSLNFKVRGGGGSGGGGALHGDGGGGGGLDGVQVGRATSSIAGIGGGGRPLATGGPGPSRTDEEIQIVFDRYKASFYRIYNRELRQDPTLRGQIVLRLTIEPDGSVSMCALQSNDMNAPELAAQVVKIVRMINFGAKDGVKALTIVYPIDFLPAA